MDIKTAVTLAILKSIGIAIIAVLQY